jgi:hypothetical protein
MNDAELSRQLELIHANVEAQHAKVRLREAHYAHEDAMERVDRLRRELEDAEADVDEKAEEVEIADDEHGKSATRVHEAMEAAGVEEANTEGRGGVGDGVPVALDSGDATWLEQLSVVRQLVQRGEIDAATDADRVLACMERDTLVDSRLLGVGVRTCHEPVLLFDEPGGESPRDHGESLDDAIRDAVSFVRGQRRSLDWATSQSSFILLGHKLEEFIALAKDECDEVLAMHALVAKVQLDAVGEPDFEAAETWGGIRRIVHRKVIRERESRERARRLPRDDSSPIALFNSLAHYAFESEAARSQTPPLHDALCTFRLRERPTDWLTPERARLPFEIRTHDMSEGFSLDGDLVAVAGDHMDDMDDIRSESGYVGAFWVPVARENLDDCKTLSDAHCVRSGGLLWDTPPTRMMHRPKGRWWPSRVLADTSNPSGRVWAVDKISCSISAYDFLSRRPVARLAFPHEVKAATRGYISFHFGLTRCGECIVGCGGTPSLHVWNSQHAVNSFEDAEHCTDGKKKESSFKDDDEKGDGERDEEKERRADSSAASSGSRKRRCIVSVPLGHSPMASIEIAPDWSCGDVEMLTATAVIAAASNGETIEGKVDYASLRVVDLAAERTVAILAGHRDSPSLARQRCAESHHLVFSIEGDGAALVFDLRTNAPAFVIPDTIGYGDYIRATLFGTGRCGILGVPTPSATVAYTWGGDEVVRAWDLRRPASHAYTFSTGNNDAIDVDWHAPTSSLLVATRNMHELSHGRYGSYRYGSYDSDNEDETYAHTNGDGARFYWPKKAKHGPDFFPLRYDCTEDTGGYRKVLQYTFDSGGG